MNIALLHIEQILGAEYVDYEAGQFNIVSGDNGTGKSSVFEAIKSALGGGNDAELIRKGAEKGEVVLVFDNGLPLKRIITQKKSETKIQGTTTPATFLNTIRDEKVINPAEFMEATDEKRLEIFLESVDFNFDWDKLSKIVKSPIAIKEEPLKVIGAWRKSIFSDRAGINKSLKIAKDALVDQRQNAIELPEVNPSETIKSLEGQIKQAETDFQTKKESLGKFGKTKADELKAVLDAEIEKLKKAYDAEVSSLRDLYEKDLETLTTESNATLNPLRSQLATSREQLRNYDKALEQKKSTERLEKQVVELTAESEEHTEQLKALDEFNENIFTGEDNKFKGVEFREGVIWLWDEKVNDFIEWKWVNQAKRAIFSNDIAKARCMKLNKEFRVICWDGMEILSDNTMKTLMESCEGDGFQYWITRVSNKPLEITNENTPKPEEA